MLAWRNSQFIAEHTQQHQKVSATAWDRFMDYRFPFKMRSSFSSRFASLSSYRLVKRRSSMDGVSHDDVPNGRSVNF